MADLIIERSLRFNGLQSLSGHWAPGDSRRLYGSAHCIVRLRSFSRGPSTDAFGSKAVVRIRSDHSTTLSFDQFNLAQTPLLREERFERAVEAQDHPPALAGHRLDPVAPLDACRLRRPDVHRRGTVGARFGGRRRVALAAGARGFSVSAYGGPVGTGTNVLVVGMAFEAPARTSAHGPRPDPEAPAH